MNLSNTQKKIFSFFTILSFSVGSMAPEILHAAANERQAQQVATILNGAKGLSSSAESYTDFVFKNVSETDKKFIASILPDLSEMPNVRAKENSVFVQNGDEEIEIELKNVLTGQIEVNGKNFVWNGDQSFRLNFQRINNLFVEKEEVSFIESLVNYVIPTAYAVEDDGEDDSDSDKNSLNKNTLAIVIGAVVAVVAVGILLYLNAKNKRKSENEKTAMNNDYNLAMHAQETERQVALAEIDSASSESSEGSDGSSSHSGDELLI